MSTRKTIKNILKESFDEFDWIKDHEVDPLMVGTFIFIGNDKSNKNIDVRSVLGKDYLILEIFSNDGEYVGYNVLPVSRGKYIESRGTSFLRAKELLAERYWRILSYKTPDYLFEDNSSIKVNDFTPYLM